jgi:DnaJ-class molecular chaperone
MNAWKVLGLDENNSKEEAKKAYRELSKELHPDMPGGDSKKFDKITKAYKAIKDGSATRSAFNSQNNQDIFDNFFGRKKKNILEVKLKDAVNNSKMKIKFKNKTIKLNCGDLKNNSKINLEGKSFKVKFVSDDFKIKGQNIMYDIEVNYVEALRGKEVEIPDLKGGTFKIKIPQNVEYGKVIKTPFDILPGGDYYVKVKVVPPKEKIKIEVI